MTKTRIFLYLRKVGKTTPQEDQRKQPQDKDWAFLILWFATPMFCNLVAFTTNDSNHANDEDKFRQLKTS